jgi:hypothetical protein
MALNIIEIEGPKDSLRCSAPPERYGQTFLQCLPSYGKTIAIEDGELFFSFESRKVLTQRSV